MKDKYKDMPSSEILEAFKGFSRQYVSIVVNKYSVLPNNISEAYVKWKEWNATRKSRFSWKYATEDQIYNKLVQDGGPPSDRYRTVYPNFLAALERFNRDYGRRIDYDIATVSDIIQHFKKSDRAMYRARFPDKSRKPRSDNAILKIEQAYNAITSST